MHMPDPSERFTVVVDGESWRRITSLAEATAADRVYVLDETSGRVTLTMDSVGSNPGQARKSSLLIAQEAEMRATSRFR